MLDSRMRADLAVYVETITRDVDVRKGTHREHSGVARARLAYQRARNALAAHVAFHDASLSIDGPVPYSALARNQPCVTAPKPMRRAGAGASRLKIA
jgi:hypothetical protein